ncbi:hypothetical protein [Ilumatobacter nonamiensis]|uniref:hypothetical protein n=1 Tax=Ilumatobacter nonamiensis TaxID=467093 RepID=UPI00034C979C|nr:hypothetical protein [Ilumatobacter nonamiensis]
MRCHVCNVEVGDGQRFCHECGESLEDVTARVDRIDASAGPPSDSDTTSDETMSDDTMQSSDAPPEDSSDRAVTGDEPDAEPVATDDEADVATVDSDDPTTSTDEDVPSTAASTPTAEVDAQPSVASTKTEPLRIVEATPASAVPSAFDDTEAVPATPHASNPADEPTVIVPVVAGTPAGRDGQVTDELPMTAPLFDGVDDVDQYTVESQGFKLRASFVLAFLALVATLMATVADTIDIRTSRPIDGIPVGIRILEDFGTNLAIGGYIGTALMLIGGLLSCFGLRWGAGLAGGAGLATAGWAAMTLGLIEVPIHEAEGRTSNAGATTTGFELEVTRDLGWFLIVAVGVIGGLVFLTSLRMAGRGRRAGLNPWVAAVGAVGAVILAVGPLIPLGEATFDLNLGFVGLSRVFFVGRLVALGLLAFTGVVGFLSVRTYGLGLVGGGLSIATWLWATSLAEFGDRPVGVAVGNLGTDETVPHAVTSVGLAVSLLMLAVATALATATRP